MHGKLEPLMNLSTKYINASLILLEQLFPKIKLKSMIWRFLKLTLDLQNLCIYSMIKLMNILHIKEFSKKLYSDTNFFLRVAKAIF